MFFLHACFLEVSLPKNQQTSWFSSEWVWLSRLARLRAYTKQVTSTDVWIWIIWHCWMLQVLLHSFTSGIHTVPVAKVTNGNDTGDCYWVGHHPTVAWVSFAFQWEKTLAAPDAQAHCAYLRGIWMIDFFFVAACWMFCLGCFFRRNPDVAFFCFNGRPTTAENPWRFRCIPVPQHCDGVQELNSQRWWNQKCPTKTGVVFFCVGTFHDPKTGRESIKYLPRVHGNSSGWSYWVQRGSRERDRSEKHDLFIRDRRTPVFYNLPKWQPNLIDGLLL